MRYYAEYDENGKIIAIGTGEDGVEITEEEYNAVLTILQIKNEYARKVYLQQITLDEVPEQYRDEIKDMVDELKSTEEPEGTSDVDYDELVNVIREGVNEV